MKANLHRDVAGVDGDRIKKIWLHTLVRLGSDAPAAVALFL